MGSTTSAPHANEQGARQLEEKEEETDKERRLKEEAISNLNSAYVMLAPSSLEGVGVFAMRDVAAGVEVLRWDW